MDSLKIIESYECMVDPVAHYELEKHCDNGWALKVKEFSVAFEEMLKASSLLHQDGEEAIQVLEVCSVHFSV